MKASLFVLKFLFIGALFIISTKDLHMNSPVERETFYESYVDWFKYIADNFIQITGYVANSEWLPQQRETEEVNFLSP